VGKKTKVTSGLEEKGLFHMGKETWEIVGDFVRGDLGSGKRTRGNREGKGKRGVLPSCGPQSNSPQTNHTEKCEKS